MEEFHAFLTEWLERREWNIPRLSRESGIADPVIRRWFPPYAKRPSDDNLKKLAPVLRVSHSELMRLAGRLQAEPAPDSQALNPDEQRLLAVFRQLEEDQRPTAVRVVEALAGRLPERAAGQRPAAGSDASGHLVSPNTPWHRPADALAAWLLGALRPRPLVGLP